MPTEDQFQILELKEQVRKLEAKIQFLYRHLGITYAYEVEAGDDSRVIEALRRGGLMEAIRVYRETYKVGLAEAKAAVEDLQGRIG